MRSNFTSVNMNASQVVYSSSTALMGPPNNRKKSHSTSLRVFSIFNIIIGLTSCVLMTAIIVPFSGGFSFSGYGPLDVVGHGIWAGVFYIIAGFLGYSASYKETNALLVWTLVLSVFSMLSAIASSTLSAIMGDGVWKSDPCRDFNNYPYYYDYYVCEVWESLEYTLLGFSVLAWIVNIVVLSLTSATVCCSSKGPKTNQMPYFITPNTNPVVGPWNNNNQPFMWQQPTAMPVYPTQQMQQLPQPIPQQIPQQNPQQTPRPNPQQPQQQFPPNPAAEQQQRRF